MTYDPVFPKGNIPIPLFQQFLTNWSQLNSSFGTDHSPYTETDQANVGHHKFVRLYQVEPIAPVLAKPQSEIYSKNVAITGDVIRALFFAQKPDTGAQIERQLTDLTVVADPANTGSAGGTMNHFDTPWNMRIYYGLTNTFSGSAKEVIFTIPYSSIFFAGAMASTGAGDITVTAIEQPTKLVMRPNNAASINWFAFGRL